MWPQQHNFNIYIFFNIVMCRESNYLTALPHTISTDQTANGQLNV